MVRQEVDGGTETLRYGEDAVSGIPALMNFA